MLAKRIVDEWADNGTVADLENLGTLDTDNPIEDRLADLKHAFGLWKGLASMDFQDTRHEALRRHVETVEVYYKLQLALLSLYEEVYQCATK